MKEITVLELKSMIDNKEDFQLIDVREQHEYDLVNLGALHIPMGDILFNTDKIDKNKKVIVHCRSGARSANVIHLLEAELGIDNLYNLKGGILAYADQVDQSLPKY
jgi:rhodanese-related sulfurtransferase